MTATTKLALELLQNNAANQTLANTTFAQLNQLVQAGVVDRLATPPGSPANEALYIITATATGVWAGKDNQLAYWLTSTNAWQFVVPREGMLVHVNDEDIFYKYTGSAWEVLTTSAEKGTITGLKLVWNSNTSISVTTGAAHIPEGSGSVVGSVSLITKSGLTLAASTFYHVYLFVAAGVVDAEVVTTTPAAPYFGTARTKTGDTTRRYIGSILTDGSGNVSQFSQTGTSVTYLTEADSAPFRTLSAGTATTGTSVSMAGVLPTTATIASVRLLSDSSVASRWSNSDVSGSVGGTTQYILPVGPGGSAILQFPVSAARDIVYWNVAAPTVGAFIDTIGYVYER